MNYKLTLADKVLELHLLSLRTNTGEKAKGFLAQAEEFQKAVEITDEQLLALWIEHQNDVTLLIARLRLKVQLGVVSIIRNQSLLVKDLQGKNQVAADTVRAHIKELQDAHHITDEELVKLLAEFDEQFKKGEESTT